MQKIYENIKKVFEGKGSFRILCGIGIVIVALLIFSAGIRVGFHKASFGRAWGEHYNENFGLGQRKGSGRMGDIRRIGMMDYFPNAHGAVGKIIKIELPNVIVQDKDNTEKVITISTDTKIQKGRDAILTADLKIDDFIIVIGTLNDKGFIEAKLLRVLPNPDF